MTPTLQSLQPTPPIKTSEVHWTYATAVTPLLERGTKRVLAPSGARVLLEFPMESDKKGVVSMRHKSIHPQTATLSYTWAVVHDPSEKNPWVVTEFSLVP